MPSRLTQIRLMCAGFPEYGLAWAIITSVSPKWKKRTTGSAASCGGAGPNPGLAHGLPQTRPSQLELRSSSEMLCDQVSQHSRRCVSFSPEPQGTCASNPSGSFFEERLHAKKHFHTAHAVTGVTNQCDRGQQSQQHRHDADVRSQTINTLSPTLRRAWLTSEVLKAPVNPNPSACQQQYARNHRERNDRRFQPG